MFTTARDIEQLLRDIHYNLVRLTRPTLHERGLTPPRFHTLWLIVSLGPLSMSQIHKKLHVSKSTVTTLVDGLVSDGLIERQRTQADRRKIMMSATEAGCNVLEVVREHRCSLVAAALEGVNQDEQARIAAALTTMKQNLNAREAQ